MCVVGVADVESENAGNGVDARVEAREDHCGRGRFPPIFSLVKATPRCLSAHGAC